MPVQTARKPARTSTRPRVKARPAWPVLKQYDQEHLRRIALPLGGIGTGTISLGGRGDLRDWEIVNRPAKGFIPPGAGPVTPFFALYARQAGAAAVCRLLEGPIAPEDYEGATGVPLPNHSLPRFRRCRFAAAYPLGQVFLEDPQVPVRVHLEAFNPLIPADDEASGLPIVVLRYVLENRTNKSVTASVCGTVPNFIGIDGSNTSGANWNGGPAFHGRLQGNSNEFRGGAGLQGLFLHSEKLDRLAEQWGSLALTVLDGPGQQISHRCDWAQRGWGDSLLDFWDDFSADGAIDDRPVANADPKASLAVRLRLAPKQHKAVTFVLAWHFPNRKTWTPKKIEEKPATPPVTLTTAAATAPAGDCCAATGCCEHPQDPDQVGNYYTTLFVDAWDAAQRAAAALPQLEEATVRFVSAFCASDLPPAVKEAALNNLTALRSQTTFRTADGRLFGWEGCRDKGGCCLGSCTHVWNYETGLGLLFGKLSRSMREVEFLFATNEQGHMSFRVHLPLTRAQGGGLAAADGQMGAIMRAYRDYRLSGDEQLLRTLWPKIKKALEFCWIPGGWDADRDGVMEGCQHNTMDVEYYGPNGQMNIWYLGALRAAQEMARRVGDDDFAATCGELFARGRQWLDRELFNGEYYEQQIRPPASPEAIAPGLRVGMGAKDLADPDFQLGKACLIDQLIGQLTAHTMGLGYLTDPGHVRKTLASIMKYNFREKLWGHFNHLRTFALGDESALLMASYPRGERPRIPFPYFNEVMTGFEYAAAAGMLYEGLTADGLRCIDAIRDRYDGRRRSPFNEAECGHHYARALASWTAVLALTGFDYSAPEQRLQFAASAKAATWFWSTGYAWGTVKQTPRKGAVELTLKVLNGSLTLRSIHLTGRGLAQWPQAKTIAAGKSLQIKIATTKGKS